jgi:hypothetical protein
MKEHHSVLERLFVKNDRILIIFKLVAGIAIPPIAPTGQTRVFARTHDTTFIWNKTVRSLADTA